MTDPYYIHVMTLSELYDTVYENKLPIIDGLLYAGVYLFVGAPKVGKSFLMAQLAYHVSTGKPMWEYNVHKYDVVQPLYLASQLPDLLSHAHCVFGGSLLNVQVAVLCRLHPPIQRSVRYLQVLAGLLYSYFQRQLY